jgi:uncharacterized caspase-like protein
MIHIRSLALAFLLLLLPAAVAAADNEAAPTSTAERRIALVLGNSAYRNVPQLGNPVNDAKAIQAELEKLGFEVVSGFDLTKLETQETIARFAKTVRGADIALFFYAGHGMQVSGSNYLLPVDAALEDETSLDFEAVQVNFILRQMSRETGVRLVFLDACRDNPLAKAFGEAGGDVSGGLAEIQIESSGDGTLVAFATSPNEVAYDGAGEHSPFASALLAHLGEANLPLTAAMTRVTGDVVKATGGLQRPWVNLSLTDEVILNQVAEPEPPAETAVAVATNDPSSASRAAGVGTGNPAADESAEMALNLLRQQIPELGTEGPISFDMPIVFGDAALDGKSLSQLIQGKPLFSPIEGLDKAVWDNQCTSCHHWTKALLCEQSKNYDKIDVSIMRLQHPYGSRFKVALANWAKNGCQ